MSFNFFNSVLAALGKRLNFESISNLFGNSFAKDASDIINGCNPLIKPRKVSVFDSLDVHIEKERKITEEVASAFDDIEKMFLEQNNN